MAYKSLQDFSRHLEKNVLLKRIKMGYEVKKLVSRGWQEYGIQ